MNGSTRYVLTPMCLSVRLYLRIQSLVELFGKRFKTVKYCYP